MTDAGLAQAIVALGLVPDNYLTAPENGKLALEDKTANMTMEIIGPPAGAVGIRMENLGHLPGIRPKLRLDRERTIRICDFLVLAELDDVSYAVFIEMKRTQSDEERPKEQLLWSAPILHYLQRLCAIAGRFSSTKTQSAEERPQEKLLWSLPILHYLRRLCAIASRFSSTKPRIPAHAGIVERYWLVSEYGGRRQLDKQTVSRIRQTEIAREPEMVTYRGITIAKHVGLSVPFSMLVER